MHTHHVNDNTATRKTPERCAQIISVIAEQRALFRRLESVGDLQFQREQEEKEVDSLVGQLAENVLIYGVTDWSCRKPKILWDIASFWFAAQRVAIRVYGQAGRLAVENARHDLAQMLMHEKYYWDAERSPRKP
ncbi:hypothetical protein [Rahnella sikkimica]|uniref:Uncharacterized protein n=1 Tax=Rahnella sikkimica TaxID=1805933 RepID=A0A2L1UZ32_9GAMM|nr:hypothetical protein [Rahnella sikkimica]AVF38185.1 hypothetical protein BV494_25230 [Rahnella sikkimica]